MLIRKGFSANMPNENQLLKALADPTRLRIVLLLTGGELCVCDLKEVLGLPQSTVSRHMATLKSAGVAGDRRDGKWVHYRLEENPLLAGMSGLIAVLSDTEPYVGDRKRLTDYKKVGACH
jgi:ArsR family transcriptional regulator, arsenate/arsenite/antimonite-responsive transcriptional repressor